MFMTVCSSCPFSSSSLLFALFLHHFPSNRQTSWFYSCSCGCRRSAACWCHIQWIFGFLFHLFLRWQNYRLFIIYRENCPFRFTLIELMKCEISLSNKTILGQSEHQSSVKCTTWVTACVSMKFVLICVSSETNSFLTGVFLLVWRKN